jgi:hypothetical protein
MASVFSHAIAAGAIGTATVAGPCRARADHQEEAVERLAGHVAVEVVVFGPKERDGLRLTQ